MSKTFSTLSNSVESFATEGNILELSDELLYSIVSNHVKSFRSILRQEPLLANHEFDLDDLVQYPWVHRINLLKATPLSIVCYHGTEGYDKMVKELLLNKYDIDVDYKTDDDMTPLNLICESFNSSVSLKIIKMLLSAGADVNIQSTYGSTPLQYLILISSRINDNEQIINLNKGYDYLLKQPNINLELKNNTGRTALHLACQRNQTQLFKKLIEKGANVNVRDDSGITPLELSQECSDFYEMYIKRKLHQSENRLLLIKLSRKLYKEGERLDENMIKKIADKIPFLKSDEYSKIHMSILKDELSNILLEQNIGPKFKTDDKANEYIRLINDSTVRPAMKKQYKNLLIKYILRQNLYPNIPEQIIKQMVDTGIPLENYLETFKKLLKETGSKKKLKKSKNKKVKKTKKKTIKK